MTIHEHRATDARPPLARWTGLEAGVPTRVAEVRRWRRLFAAAVSIGDLVAVTITAAAAQVIRFGIGTRPVLVFSGEVGRGVDITYTVVSIAMVVGWTIALRLFDTHDHKIIGSGSLEFTRVAAASLAFFGGFAILAFLVSAEVGRGYLIIALPVGLALLMLNRWLWRRWLTRHRSLGRFRSHAIVVGDTASVAGIAARSRRMPAAGSSSPAR